MKNLVKKFLKLLENPDAIEVYNQIKKEYEENNMKEESKVIQNIIEKKFR